MSGHDALGILRQVTDSVPLKRADHHTLEDAYRVLLDAVNRKPAMDGQDPKVT